MNTGYMFTINKHYTSSNDNSSFSSLIQGLSSSPAVLYNDLDPCDWGWKLIGNTLQPVATTLPPAPTKLLHLVSCRCKTSCISCEYKRANLLCSAMCSQCEGRSCQNTPEFAIEHDDNDDYRNVSTAGRLFITAPAAGGRERSCRLPPPGNTAGRADRPVWAHLRDRELRWARVGPVSLSLSRGSERHDPAIVTREVTATARTRHPSWRRHRLQTPETNKTLAEVRFICSLDWQERTFPTTLQVESGLDGSIIATKTFERKLAEHREINNASAHGQSVAGCIPVARSALLMTRRWVSVPKAMGGTDSTAFNFQAEETEEPRKNNPLFETTSATFSNTKIRSDPTGSRTRVALVGVYVRDKGMKGGARAGSPPAFSTCLTVGLTIGGVTMEFSHGRRIFSEDSQATKGRVIYPSQRSCKTEGSSKLLLDVARPQTVKRRRDLLILVAAGPLLMNRAWTRARTVTYPASFPQHSNSLATRQPVIVCR
ncbi:hypothetical protein PR048_028184 [Dryococelus australis]|uniref:Uncharacterized protein n=1 Tax=Dryococelus australis TaxID=614101 RepID=A0ABQ9GIJ8_9NEOP|nr:hypothetical protein PR048_028184 [Dryococelus australis]